MPKFENRTDAGRQLAAQLDHLRGRDAIVLGLPRGGVPIAAEVAAALGAPLDVLVVRKLASRRSPEYAIGAIGDGGVRVLDPDAARQLPAEELEEIERRERIELARRTAIYRAGRGPLDLRGKTVLIIDDGVATGASARAACSVAREFEPASIVLAVPVAPRDWVDRIGDVADECVAVLTPSAFFAVGQFYADFDQTSDEEVCAALARTTDG